MRQIYFLFTLILCVFYLTNCGGSSQTNISNIPEWFLNTPNDPNYIFAPARGQSKDLQLAIDKATTDGRAEVARQIETKLQGLQKKFDEEVGVGEDATLLQQFTQANKTVVSTVLSGSSVIKKSVFEKGSLYEAYVLVQYPIGAASAAYMNQLKKAESYTRFRSSETFKELEDEVKKYEEWKEKQGM